MIKNSLVAQKNKNTLLYKQKKLLSFLYYM